MAFLKSPTGCSQSGKHYYDRKQHTVSYTVGDLLRVKTHTKSKADTNVTASWHSICWTIRHLKKKGKCQLLSTVDTRGDAAMFQVANLHLHLFHWQAMTKTSSCQYVNTFEQGYYFYY